MNLTEVSMVENYLSISGTNEEKISKAKQLLGSIDAGKKGIEELETILNYQFATHLP
jgi:histidyl-tRNA synthetase